MINFFNQFSEAIATSAGADIASLLTALVVLAVFFALAKIASFLFSQVFTKTKGAKKDVDNEIVKALNMLIFYSVILLGVYESFTYIAIFTQFSGEFSKIIKSAAIIVWMFAFSNLVSSLVMRFGHKFGQKASSSDEEFLPLFRKVSKILIYFVGIMIMLRIWNLDITPFLASAGIAGFIVAFAAQDTISHLFGGVSIYFDKPFKVGDRVQLESGEIGDVLEIGIRSTRIKTFDETVVIMPNSKIANSKIINYNLPKSKIKCKITIGVSYDSDIDKVKSVLLDIAKNTEDVAKDPAPSVYFSEFGEYDLKFLIITWVAGPNQQFDAKTRMNEAILKRFRQEGIQIPYPTRDINLRK